MATTIMSNLSRPPEREKYPVTQDQSGKYWAEIPLPWLRWFSTIQQLLAPVASGGLLLWNSVSKVGSNIADIATRNHDDLQNINTAAHTHLTSTNATALTGSADTTLHYHASDRSLANATGTLLAAQFPALSSDVTTTAGSLATTLATVNTNIGSYGSASAVSTFTVNGKGLITAAGSVAIAIANTAVSGLGTMSTQNSSTVAITGGTITGVTAEELIEYNVPVTGFTYTIANTTNVLVLEPAGVLATGTINMPASPSNNQTVRVTSTQTITALTMSPNAGQTLDGGLTTIAVNGFGSWAYRLANTTWYRIG